MGSIASTMSEMIHRTHEQKPLGYFDNPLFGAYILPREGKLERCQDKMAHDSQKARYVVADGVGTSFLPGRWAEILTRDFVSSDCPFDNPQEITNWLMDCSQAWHAWVEDVWVSRARQNNAQADWSREIARGAAATLAGCFFSPVELAQTGTTNVRVVVVGDAEFFLLARESLVAQPRWRCKRTWYLQLLEEFGHTTQALATPEKRVLRDHRWVNVTNVEAKAGDCLILATDALAKWILQYIEQGKDPWNKLFALRNQEDFQRFVSHYRADGSLEIDDTTLMIIPVEAAILSNE